MFYLTSELSTELKSRIYKDCNNTKELKEISEKIELLTLSDDNAINKLNAIYDNSASSIYICLDDFDNLTFYPDVTPIEVIKQMVDDDLFGCYDETLKRYIDCKSILNDMEHEGSISNTKYGTLLY